MFISYNIIIIIIIIFIIICEAENTKKGKSRTGANPINFFTPKDKFTSMS